MMCTYSTTVHGDDSNVVMTRIGAREVVLEELVDMDSIDGARNIDNTGVADEIRLGVAVTVPVFF